jgi:hypothetical protein
MSLTKDQYRQVDRLNKRLEKFDKMGLKSEATEQARTALEAFYLKHDINVGKMKGLKFKKRTANMSQSQVDEMMEIADMFENSIGSRVADYTQKKKIPEHVKKAFETVKKKYPNQVKTWQDYINFIDRNKNVDKGIAEYYDSDEVSLLYDNAFSLGLTEKEVNNIIASQIINTQLAHDKRYDTTFNAIKDYYKKKKKRKNKTRKE